MTSVSVVIPNLHSPLLDEVLAALGRQTGAALISEIIVVGQHNGASLAPPARMVTTPRPLAAAAARNLGAQQASGDYLLFLDADCLAAPDLLARLYARHQEGHAVVGGSVALETGNYWRLCDNLLSFTPFLATATPGPRPYLPSLNFSLPRELLLAVGGFDESFPGAAGEDLDLSLRLRNQGQELFFEPRAIVYHRPQRSSARLVARHLRAFGRVHLRLQRRYAGRAAPHLSPRMRPWAGLILAAAPLLALADGLSLLGRQPPLRPYWPCLPGLVWGKAAWYWGLAEALLATPAAPAQ